MTSRDDLDIERTDWHRGRFDRKHIHRGFKQRQDPQNDIATGIINRFSGANQGRGDGAEPQFATTNNPRGVAVAPDGTIYFSDTKNDKVRKISGGIVSTVAGTGMGGFTFPENALSPPPPGSAIQDASPPIPRVTLFIADRGNARIRKLDTSGNLTTVAGATNLTTNAAGVVTGGASVTGYYNDGIAAVVARRVCSLAVAFCPQGSTANFTSGPGAFPSTMAATCLSPIREIT